MASATVNLKVSPREMDLIISCIEESLDEQKDLLDDPVVKEEDKREAGQSMMELEGLLRQLRG